MEINRFRRLITKEELQNVLNEMLALECSKGFMDYDKGDREGKIKFYNYQPNFKNIQAVPVTKGELMNQILNY